MTDSTFSCGDQIRMMQQYGGKTEADARAQVQTDFKGICVPCGASAGGAVPSAPVSCAVADLAMADAFHTCGFNVRMMKDSGMTEADARLRVQTDFPNCACAPSAGGAAPSATVPCAVADQRMTDSTFSCGDQIRMMMQYGGKTEAAARAQVQTDFSTICVPCT